MRDAKDPIAGLLRQALGREPLAGPPVRELRVEDLSKHYGSTRALEGVSIDFRPGSVHTILGENGSGKSTLLKILSGVTAPSAGRVVLNGRTVRPRTPLDMQRLGLGTVFQEVLITPHRSVTENVLLGIDGLVARRLPRGRRPAVVAALLDALGETRIAPDAPAGALPLAAQQIVVLARAFAKLPPILLLDEATAALDLGDREKVFATIRDYAAAGRIVVFISHRMDEVRRLSDRVSVLRSGRLVETLERDEITEARLLALMAPEARDAA